jgi:hypothetical protein
MSTPGPGESSPNPPCIEELLADVLGQIRTTMEPDLTGKLLPEGTTLLGVRTELYQSPTLGAGRDVMPGQYPPDDRNLIILTLQDDKQVFFVGGRISPTDQFDIDSSLGGGVDPREIHRVAYAYDGGQTIVEHLPDGSTNRYEGMYGDPEMLLSHIRGRLGACIAVESAGVDPSA